MKMKWLELALTGVPEAEQRITSADMRQTLTDAMSVKMLVLIATVDALACLACGFNVAVTQSPPAAILRRTCAEPLL